MTPAPHETPEFANAVTYTVAVTVTVAGGARHGTDDRRACAVAERLANTAARAAGVVDVTATAGRSTAGETVAPERVRFTAANCGQGTYGEPDRLDRYLDPDHERALASLAAANAAYRERRHADQARRRAVGCPNACRASLDRRPCGCVYCDPAEHHSVLRLTRQHGARHLVVSRCLCGQPVPTPGQRCPHHRYTALVVLDDDDPALQRLAHDPDAQPRP